MKRSRACEDLRALECSAASSPRTGQHQTQPFLNSRVKRSRRVVDVLVDSDFSDLEELSEGFFAAFRLDPSAATKTAGNSVGVGSSSSSSSSSTSAAMDDDCDCPQFDVVDRFASSYDRLGLAAFDECLPAIRRNSRDALPVVECDAVSLTALQFKKKLQLAAAEPMLLVDAVVDAPETDLLGRFQFDKRQAFASLFMLPVNPNR